MAASALSAAGEEQLSKEITVEREIVPEVRAASRLNLYPRAILYRPQGKTLALSEPDNSVAVSPAIAQLEPAATEPAFAPTPWRGYVNAGYFPAANVALSAGYAILSDDATRLNVWAQLDNKSYKDCVAKGLQKVSFGRFDGRVGVDFSHRFDQAGTLELSTGVGFSSFAQAWSLIEKSISGEGDAVNQNVTDWVLTAMWRGQGGDRLSYHVGAGFDIFNFSKGLPAEIAGYPYEMDFGVTTGNASESAAAMFPAVHQTGFNADFGVEQQINGESSAGVNITADFLNYNHFNALSGKTLGVASLRPYYRFGNRTVSLKAGLRMDFTVNSGKALHLAPDVLLGINPASGFGAWLRLGGGEELNSLRTLFDYSPYISQLYAYGTSNLPVTSNLGLRFGPVHGASLTLGAAYAAANNWLLPEMAGGELLFGRHDLRSWKVSAKLHWEFRRMLSLDASFESTLGNGEKDVWMQWRDRARHCVTAAVAFRPVEKLTVDVSYELRMKRRMPLMSEAVVGLATDDAADGVGCVGLKDLNNLGAGAAYRITDAFTVFARADNILGSKTYQLPLVPEQGFTGLVGAAYKF